MSNLFNDHPDEFDFPGQRSYVTNLEQQLEAAKLREADLQQAHCEATKRAVHIGLERDAARNALEIANDLLKRIEELLSSHVGTRERMRVRNIIKQTLVDTSNHTAALAERDQIRDQARDRAIERKTAERCKAIAETRGERDETNESGGAIDVEYGALCVADLIDREFNLEPSRNSFNVVVGQHQRS